MSSPASSPAKGRVLVEIRGLAKSYHRGSEEIRVFEGVDLDIRDGEFLALMGPSGSGTIATFATHSQNAGPNEMFSTRFPSITSRCSQSAPASCTCRMCS